MKKQNGSARRKWGAWCLFLALLLMLLAACTGKTPAASDDRREEETPPASSEAALPGETEVSEEELPDGQQTPEENTGSGEEAPPEETEAPPSEGEETPQPYSADEIIPLFSVSEEAVLSLYGKPEKEEKIALYAEDSAVRYLFGGGSFFCFEYVSRLDGATLYEALLTDDRLAAPRGVRIGDDLEELLGKFPDSGDETLHTAGEDPPYRLLYGEYIHMGDFGAVEYEDGVPARVIYASQGTAVSFELENEKVVSVHYTIPMN